MDMDLLLVRETAILIACALAAYTDYKTGFIYDKITYSLMGFGALLLAFDFWQAGNIDWAVLAIPVAVFAGGLLLYYSGKTGGGDVKLLSGIAITLPWLSGRIFVAGVLLAASLLAIVVMGAYFITKYALSKPRWTENKGRLPIALLLAMILTAYFWFAWSIRIFSGPAIALLTLPMAIAVLFLALEPGIRRQFFLKRVGLDQLEEDEIIAREYCDEQTRMALAGSSLGVLTENEIAKLRDAGIENVPVYRGLPPFGPFILAGVLLSLFFPQWLGLLMPV